MDETLQEILDQRNQLEGNGLLRVDRAAPSLVALFEDPKSSLEDIYKEAEKTQKYKYMSDKIKHVSVLDEYLLCLSLKYERHDLILQLKNNGATIKHQMITTSDLTLALVVAAEKKQVDSIKTVIGLAYDEKSRYYLLNKLFHDTIESDIRNYKADQSYGWAGGKLSKFANFEELLKLKFDFSSGDGQKQKQFFMIQLFSNNHLTNDDFLDFVKTFESNSFFDFEDMPARVNFALFSQSRKVPEAMAFMQKALMGFELSDKRKKDFLIHAKNTGNFEAWQYLLSNKNCLEIALSLFAASATQLAWSKEDMEINKRFKSLAMGQLRETLKSQAQISLNVDRAQNSVLRVAKNRL